MSKLRKVGDIMLDLEKILEELSFDHDLQWGEVRGLVKSWLEIHAPSQQEEYEDGSNPVDFYGHKEEYVKRAKKINKRTDRKN